MATFEYECTRCKQTFEVERRIGDPPMKTLLHTAPPAHEGVCNGEVKRLVSSPAFVLKGSGWAKDGYRK